MPKRRLNFTKRQRLAREDANISLIESDSGYIFDVVLNLAKYDLPIDATVFVEAYRQTQYERFSFGRIGLIQKPDDRRLTGFDSVEGVKFRIKVVSSADPVGLLLAEGDGISPRADEVGSGSTVSLLPVVLQDISPQIWSLDFDEQQVLLQINSTLANASALARDKTFIALVFPTIVRIILNRILVHEDYRDVDDLEDWRSQWLAYATGLPGVGNVPKDRGQGSLDDWIESAVDSFSRCHQVLGGFSDIWQGGE
ncbi:MAG TPA: hypothetical protein PKI57_09200 [Myxococcota bacterium]|nr:hypothetical protein [Myxococcota bacterium]